MMKRNRVVVTGLGAVTPAGLTFQNTWSAIMESYVPCGPVKQFDASGLPCSIAYEVEGFRSESRDPMTRATSFAMEAASEALAQAGFDREAPASTDIQVCLGVGMGSPDLPWFIDHYLEQDFADTKHFDNFHIYDPNHATRLIAELSQATGGMTTVHTACASSGQSIGEAYEALAWGDCQVVVTGGLDSMINPFHMAGFCLLGALATGYDHPKTACRPFAKERKGFVLGEGACILILENLEHALNRGATPLAEICGYGVSESAYRITDLHPEGHGPIEAMEQALHEAGISPDMVGYINAHGTSTKLNDQVESLAIDRVFGPSRPYVSSTKPFTGHLISAAGAIELALSIESMRRNILMPSVMTSEQDPGCPVKLTPSEPSPYETQFVLSDSVGFGGSNTAIVAGRI